MSRYLVLSHSSTREWDNHKYLYKIGNRYIYDYNKPTGKSSNPMGGRSEEDPYSSSAVSSMRNAKQNAVARYNSANAIAKYQADGSKRTASIKAQQNAAKLAGKHQAYSPYDKVYGDESAKRTNDERNAQRNAARLAAKHPTTSPYDKVSGDAEAKALNDYRRLAAKHPTTSPYDKVSGDTAAKRMNATTSREKLDAAGLNWNGGNRQYMEGDGRGGLRNTGWGGGPGTKYDEYHVVDDTDMGPNGRTVEKQKGFLDIPTYSNNGTNHFEGRRADGNSIDKVTVRNGKGLLDTSITTTDYWKGQLSNSRGEVYNDKWSYSDTVYTKGLLHQGYDSVASSIKSAGTTANKLYSSGKSKVDSIIKSTKSTVSNLVNSASKTGESLSNKGKSVLAKLFGKKK